jgi:putative ABC transport system substrate-binding protein
MRRREFISLLGGAAATSVLWTLPLSAEQRTRRIGVLVGAGADPQRQSWIAGFRRKLQEFGWEDGRNLQLDLRWGGADIDYIRASCAFAQPAFRVPDFRRLLCRCFM